MSEISEQVAVDERERTTVIGLLDWAFQRQRAHLNPPSEGFELRLGSPRDSCAKIEHMRGIMGCQIDGGQWKEIGHRVHPDALEVVAAVSRVPGISGELVWQYARSGTTPDWGEVCRVWPTRRENGKIAVEKQDIVIVNRRRQKSTITVSYCPFEIFPNVEYCREEWRLWYRGLVRLEAEMPELQRWRVAGVGVEVEPWE